MKACLITVLWHVAQRVPFPELELTIKRAQGQVCVCQREIERVREAALKTTDL